CPARAASRPAKTIAPAAGPASTRTNAASISAWTARGFRARAWYVLSRKQLLYTDISFCYSYCGEGCLVHAHCDQGAEIAFSQGSKRDHGQDGFLRCRSAAGCRGFERVGLFE